MNKHELHVIGLMSGTSLDGLDLAHVLLHHENNRWTYTLLEVATQPYDTFWLTQLRNAPSLNPTDLMALNNAYSTWLGKEVNAFRKQNGIAHVDLIASHGHTVYHQPEKRRTVQIGNTEALCRETRLPVVCDFRLQDVLLGGQGAPLVPIGDALLFADFDACLNLGGFANLSYHLHSQRIAYDICPVNIVLNSLSQKLGKDFDHGGELARAGSIDVPLLDALNSLAYFTQKPPKSLGREWVELHVFPLLENKSTHVALRTYTEHIAQQIGLATKHAAHKKLLITGGGAFNGFLVERIAQTSAMKAHIPEHNIITHKEALIFALLGALRWLGQDNCLASVTGAKANHSSGRIFCPA